MLSAFLFFPPFDKTILAPRLYGEVLQVRMIGLLGSVWPQIGSMVELLLGKVEGLLLLLSPAP